MTTTTNSAPGRVSFASRRLLWLGAISTLLGFAILADILIGPAFLNVFDVLAALVNPSGAPDPMVVTIVHAIRLPMTLMALIVGASLGIAGVQMQTILGNPLASPYTLGFSAAAGFGAAITILFGWQLPLIPQMTVPVAAFQDHAIGALRGGQRQLVFLAQSLFRSPDVLLLDEPTAALDLRHQLIVLERIVETCRDSGMIAVAAMHDLTLAARFANRIMFLHEGQVAADGPPAKVLTPAILEQVYRVVAEVQPGPSGALHVSPVRALNNIGAG